jgi:hypothetical protein
MRKQESGQRALEGLGSQYQATTGEESKVPFQQGMGLLPAHPESLCNFSKVPAPFLRHL